MTQIKLNLSLRQWMVLLSSFLVSGIGMGFFFVSGQLFVGIRNTLNGTTAETVVVQSVTIAVLHVTGMPNGALTHKYGPRTVGIVGTTLTSVGFVSSFFATSIGFLAVMIGIFVATGISALMVSCTVAGKEHFRAKTSGPLALSFISAGTSVGGMAYPYYIQFLSDTYALRGTLLMIGTLLLHSLPCALLWSPPENTEIKSIEISVIKVAQEHENRNMTQSYSESKDYEQSRSTSSDPKYVSEDKVNSPREHHKNIEKDNTRTNFTTTKESSHR